MHLHVAWLGDSKAILSTGGGFTVELTEDHRATNPKVKKKFLYKTDESPFISETVYLLTFDF